MNLDAVQSAGVSTFFLISMSVIHAKLSKPGREKMHKWFSRGLILLTSIVLFFGINLYSAAQDQLRMFAIIQKYSMPATFDLIGLVHDPSHKVHMEGNHIFIDQGTDNERIFVLMKEPFFSIIDQGKLVSMSKELLGDDVADAIDSGKKNSSSGSDGE